MITIRAEMSRRDSMPISVDIGSAPSQINIINSAAQRQRPKVINGLLSPGLKLALALDFVRCQWLSAGVE